MEDDVLSSVVVNGRDQRRASAVRNHAQPRRRHAQIGFDLVGGELRDSDDQVGPLGGLGRADGEVLAKTLGRVVTA